MENETVTPIVEEPVIEKPIVPQVPLEPKKKNNFFKIVVILIGILVVLGLFANAYLMFSKKETVSKTPDSSVIATPTPTPDPTADWKTYSNAVLGFEIKHPSSVLVEKELNDQYNRVTVFKGGSLNFEVMLRKNLDKISLDKYYFMDAPIKETTAMGGVSANVYEMPTGYCDGPGCSEPYIAVVTEKGSDFYHLTFFGDSKLSEVENQILSTFKFIDQNQTANNTNLKTFSSKTLGISFTYKGQIGGETFRVSEIGSKVYIGSGLPITNGQSVEVFEKNSDETITEAIKRKFLAGKSESECFVIEKTLNNYSSNFIAAEITYPTFPNEDMETLLKKTEYCSPNYARTNGLRYFLADKNHPDKFLFSIGQYPISFGDNKAWQDTIKFLD